VRVAIYARYSTELQSDRSIDDQVALCRAYAGRQGWQAVDPPYADYAVSGASVHGRFAFERLVADARRGLLDAILAEDLDRLSRNQADIAGLYEAMTFLGIGIHTFADGLVTEMHIGLKGTMSALFLKALAVKIRRGMAGRVREGKVPGGLTYGYKVTSVGEREIVPEKAEVVRRVFRETLEGKTPRGIAYGLNKDGIPSPSGGHWNASTINGSRKRGNGVLRNELYIGRLVWNRLSRTPAACCCTSPLRITSDLRKSSFTMAGPGEGELCCTIQRLSPLQGPPQLIATHQSRFHFRENRLFLLPWPRFQTANGGHTD
jgi:DNA invertase Pin-like site-specific DNA recombinase